MNLPKQGLDRAVLEARLEEIAAHDLDWRSGRVFAYVYDDLRGARDVGKAAYMRFLTENALDPTVFPSALRFETDVVDVSLRHLGAGTGAAGTFTNGGTESILLAVKACRDHALATRPRLNRPQIVLPDTAHAAFHKAASYLGLDKVVVPTDPHTFRADVQAMRDAVTDRTILLVGSAPSYAHGVIDPIADLGALALEKKLWLHVDACVGGWLLPWFRRLGAPVPAYDFGVPGVTSMSMDLHKYAFCPKGASIVAYRDRTLRFYQHFACAQWSGYTMINPTIQSSKSVGPMASAWAVLNHLGDAGYEAIARETLEGTRKLVAGLRAIDGLRVLGEPEFSLAAAAAEGFSVFHLVDLMRRRKWYVQPQLRFNASPENVHFSLHPGNVRHVDALLADLREAVPVARAKPVGVKAKAVKLLFLAGTPRFSDGLFRKLLALADVKGSELPGDMADINEILNSLPRDVTEKLLTAYINELYGAGHAASGVPDEPGAEAPHEDEEPTNGHATASTLPPRLAALDAALRRLPTGDRVADELARVGALLATRFPFLRRHLRGD